MNARHLLAAACFVSLLTGADARTFTNTAGTQIEAELIAVEDGKAVLKLANNRTAKLTLTMGDKEVLKEGYPDGFLDRLEEEAKRQEAREEEARKKAERNSKQDQDP